MPAHTFPLPAWGNASSDQLGYDGAGRMITRRYLTGGIDGTTHAYTNTTALVGHTTSFDRAGNKLYERHLEAESRSHLYQPFNNDSSFGVGYDSANRLMQVQRGVLSSATIPYRVNPGASISTPTTLPGADQVRTYGLDGLGNWKTTNFTLVGSGGSTTNTAEVRQHNYANQITSTRDNGGTPTPFVYDQLVFPPYLGGNGNIVNDGIRIYQYDVYNRLIEVKKASDSTVLATYVYDGLNRRIQKTISNGGLSGDITNGTTDYLYDGDQIVEERNHASPTVWTQVYFWGQYIDELMFLAVSIDDAPVTYRVLSDLLYRSVALVTTSNVVTEAYDCDAYGNTLCYSGPGTDGLWFTDDDVTTHSPINTTIFTGRQFDPESQIYYYRARYFSPTIGRFISRDPAGTRGGINLYAYVRGNPADGLDPFGRLTFNVNKATSDNSLTDGNTDPNYPGGANTQPTTAGDLAFTNLQWSIKAECKCKDKKWTLSNTTVNMNAHISYRPSYASAALSAWVHEKEQDHVADFNWWGRNTGKQAAQQFEKTQKTHSYDDQATCESAAESGMQSALIPSAEAEANQTIDTYDNPHGKKPAQHTYMGP